MQTTNNQSLLTVAEVAERLSLTPGTVYELLKSGQLKGSKIGQWRVCPTDLEAYIAANSNQPREVTK